MPVALTRAVPSALVDCELTHLDRTPIDLARARAQHGAYERALERLGCTVRRLPPLDDQADSVFVEDVAVVLPELAVVTRPGAASRRSETAGLADWLGLYREVVAIRAPATVEGGDVLRIGRDVYVGQGGRTNAAGLEALRAALEPRGYRVAGVPLRGCLHLKTGATALADDLLVVNPEWVDPAALGGRRHVAVDPAEPFAANALRVGPRVLFPAAFARTRARLEAEGVDVVTVEADELARAEAGLTCCSIVFEA